MVFPLDDADPLEGDRIPWVTYGLLALNIVIFSLSVDIPRVAGFDWRAAGSFIPDRFWSSDNSSFSYLALTPLTYQFLHHGWLHLLLNMLYLWIFGDNVEDAIGRFRFILLYLLAGVAAAGAHFLSAPHSTEPLAGASGAIAGVIAAYAMLRPCAKIEILVIVYPVVLPAYLVIAAWFSYQAVRLLWQADSGPAWAAHVGGFLAGLLLVCLLRPRDVPLFQCMPDGAGPRGNKSAKAI